QHGPLMFHQSGGCCDGSSPMCCPAGEFRIGDADVHLGDLDIGAPEQVPVWMSRVQYELWSHPHLTIDVVDGRGSGFSWRAPTGRMHFTRSRPMTDEETEQTRSALPEVREQTPGRLRTSTETEPVLFLLALLPVVLFGEFVDGQQVASDQVGAIPHMCRDV